MNTKEALELLLKSLKEIKAENEKEMLSKAGVGPAGPASPASAKLKTGGALHTKDKSGMISDPKAKHTLASAFSGSGGAPGKAPAAKKDPLAKVGPGAAAPPTIQGGNPGVIGKAQDLEKPVAKKNKMTKMIGYMKAKK